MMSVLSYPFSPSPGNSLLIPQPTLKSLPALTSRRMVLGTTATLCIFGVRVFSVNTPSYHGLQLDLCYRRHEGERRQAYEQWVCEIEHGSFTPVVFNTANGMGKATKSPTSTLPSSSPSSMCNHIVSLWIGCGAICPYYFVLPWCA